MAKSSGLGDNLYIDGYDLSGDIGSLSSISGSINTIDVTGIDKLAFERIGGKRDGSISFNAYFNPATSRAHPRLSLLPTTDVSIMYCRGTTIGSASACMVGKQVNYDPTRGADGSLTFNVTAHANGFGLEWGYLLTPGTQTDTTGGSVTSLDQTTVSTSFGWQAYLQVFNVTGTNLIVTLADSADNSSFTNLTSGAFASATSGASPQVQRLVSPTATSTVRRYIRVTSSGTFTSASYAVMFVRNINASVVF